MGIGARLNEQTFSHSSAAAREARRWVRGGLAELGVDDPDQTAELLVSELISNVVLHTGSRPSAWLERLPGAVRIHVHDESGGEPTVLSPGPREATGRGLAIVEQLALRWGVDRYEQGKSVWFEIPDRHQG